MTPPGPHHPRHRDPRRPQGAVLDPARRYRYLLWRRWGEPAAPFLHFVLLNPSTADARADDPTIIRCSRRARDLGYGGLLVTNLFAFRATDPRALKQAADPVGPANDAWIAAAAAEGRTVLGWGQHGRFQGRDQAVLRLLAGQPLYCLRTGRDGAPCHPLYLPYALQPVPYTVASA